MIGIALKETQKGEFSGLGLSLLVTVQFLVSTGFLNTRMTGGLANHLSSTKREPHHNAKEIGGICAYKVKLATLTR